MANTHTDASGLSVLSKVLVLSVLARPTAGVTCVTCSVITCRETMLGAGVKNAVPSKFPRGNPQ